MNNLFGGTVLVYILSGGFALLLGGIGVVLIFLYLRNKSKAEASYKWPSTLGRAVNWDIKIDSYDDEDFSKLSYLPKMTYIYHVNGLDYQGHKFSFGSEPSFPQRSKAEAFLAQFTSKAEFTVYYNPEKPGEAVLTQKMRSMTAGLVVGIVLIVMMVCFLCPIGNGIINSLKSL
jgi:hypothetical protein